jgi:hypothetical protein
MLSKPTANQLLKKLVNTEIRNVLNERLVDRVRNLSGLNTCYANKIVTAPVASVPHTDKDNIDLSKFKKARFKPIKFISLAQSSDGKNLAIVDADHGIQIYVDLVNLRELQPINESYFPDAVWRISFISRGHNCWLFSCSATIRGERHVDTFNSHEVRPEDQSKIEIGSTFKVDQKTHKLNFLPPNTQAINEARAAVSPIYNRMLAARENIGLIARSVIDTTISKIFFDIINIIDSAARPFTVQNAKISAEGALKRLKPYVPQFVGTSVAPRLEFAISELNAALKETH